jgi:hypothetical protein
VATFQTHIKQVAAFFLCISKFVVLSHVLVTKTGFGLVIEFIYHLQAVTTIDYHIVPDLHTQIAHH